MQRKWFRFSLRILLVVLIVFPACGLGLAVWELETYDESARAELDERDRIRQLQGSYDTSPRGPKWLSFLPDSIRPPQPQFVTSISLPLESTDPGYSDEVLKLLGKFKYLKRLTIDGGAMSLVDRRYRPGLYVVEKDKVQQRFPNVHCDWYRL